MFDRRITLHLAGQSVAHAVIGGVALAVHGAPRYSDDLDLLVLDDRVLAPAFWAGAGTRPTALRRGDWEDPLGGVADFPAGSGEVPVQVVVGRGPAARIALDGAEANPDLACPVVSPVGLALLKLEAGGIRDLQDLVALKEARRILTGQDLMGDLEAHLRHLSAHGRAAWARLCALTGWTGSGNQG